MSAQRISLAGSTAAFLAILLGSAPAVAWAQKPAPPPAKPHEHEEGTKGKGGMSAMMAEPHHALAMAHRDNVATFGRALQKQVNTGKAVNLDLARPAVVEMRRSFEEMRNHHQAHLATMPAPADSATLAMKHHMETHVAELGEHLSALEAALSATVPDPVRVKERTASILQECASMSGMPGKSGKSSMPPKPKPPHTP